MAKDKQAGDRVERRFVPGVEVRVASADDDEPGVIEGYAAVFNSDSEDLGGFIERIKPGAFKEALAAGYDAVSAVNHDPNMLIGRKSVDTLRMKQDRIGLRVEIYPPDTTVGRDTLTLIKRGDMNGMSFAFSGVEDKWETKNGIDIRTITKVGRIHDASPVTNPAYADTTVAVRALAEYRTAKTEDEDESEDEGQQPDAAAQGAVAVRERELQLAEL